MGKLGFYLNMNTCLGCGACQLACKDIHDLLPGEYMRRVETLAVEGKDGPLYLHFSGGCQHCSEADCIAACPTGAMQRLEDGCVVQDPALCIGCGSCLWNCPNGAISFSKTTGKAQKCDSCREFRQRGYEPACCGACPTHSLHFGDLDQMKEEYGLRGEDLLALPLAKTEVGELLVKLPDSMPKDLAADVIDKKKAEEAESKGIEFNAFETQKGIRDDSPSGDPQRTKDRKSGNAFDYIIIGSGAAGLAAAEGIRSRDPEGSILMLGEEKIPPYSRPLLSKTPLANYSLSRLFLRDPAWYEEQKIELHTEERVIALSQEEPVLESTKARYRYGKLILACGASPFVPPIPGSDGPGIHVLRSHEDILALKRRGLAGGRCVIIGGGVIGLEAAFELSRYGVEVTVLEALPMLMPRFLDEESAAKVEASLRSFSVHSAVEISGIEQNDKSTAFVAANENEKKHSRQRGEAANCETQLLVRLKDGRSFPCDFLLMATGVRANTALAQEAGIACGRGILINEYGETEWADVYACGDCAEYEGRNYQLWSQALEQGRVAGCNAAGGRERLRPFDSSLILNSPELALFSCGDVGKEEGVSYRVEKEERDGREGYRVNPAYGACYEKRFYREDRLVGAILLGHLGKMQAYKEAILGIRPKEAKDE